jgi:uncharacterized membrane protein YfcA
MKRLAIIALAVVMAADALVVVAFRHTANWRLGRYITWGSPLLIVVAGVALAVLVRGRRWWVVGLLVLVLSYNVSLQRGYLDRDNACPRPRLNAQAC